MRPVAPITVALSLVLLGCSPSAVSNDAASVEASAVDVAPSDPAADHVLCAQGAVPLTDDCTIERAADGIVTIRHPDGAFRRFNADGTAADGAETAVVTSVEGGREITVGGDHYRLPETRR